MPFHDYRRWKYEDVSDMEDLAKRLTSHIVTLCTGYRHRGYFYLNDAIHEEGAGEYAIVRESDLRQVESITFSWCTVEQALGYIQEVSSGTYDGENYGSISNTQVLPAAEHRGCPLCS